MDGLQWKTLLKWMIWGYHYFWKHPDIVHPNIFLGILWGIFLHRGEFAFATFEPRFKRTVFQIHLSGFLLPYITWMSQKNKRPEKKKNIYNFNKNTTCCKKQLPFRSKKHGEKKHTTWFHLGVSKNNDTPKSSVLIGFSIVNC